MQLRQRNSRVRGDDPQEVDRSELRMPEDFHGMRVLVPVWKRQLIDVPQLGPAAEVLRVVIVQEERKLAVAAGLARILRRGLAGELKDAAARFADLSQDQVDVVHLAGGGGRLVRLIDAL